MFTFTKGTGVCQILMTLANSGCNEACPCHLKVAGTLSLWIPNGITKQNIPEA